MGKLDDEIGNDLLVKNIIQLTQTMETLDEGMTAMYTVLMHQSKKIKELNQRIENLEKLLTLGESDLVQ